MDEVVIGENTESPIPDATVDDVLTCTTLDAILDGSGSSASGPLSFQWLDGSNNEISDTSTAIVDAPGIYTLIITNTENGCSDETSIEVFQDIEEPNAVAEEPDMLTCSTTSVQLDGSASNGSGQLSYQWLDSGNNEIGVNETVDVGSPDTYTLIVTNIENGCTNETNITVDQDIENPTTGC